MAYALPCWVLGVRACVLFPSGDELRGCFEHVHLSFQNPHRMPRFAVLPRWVGRWSGLPLHPPVTGVKRRYF